MTRVRPGAFRPSRFSGGALFSWQHVRAFRWPCSRAYLLADCRGSWAKRGERSRFKASEQRETKIPFSLPSLLTLHILPLEVPFELRPLLVTRNLYQSLEAIATLLVTEGPCYVTRMEATAKRPRLVFASSPSLPLFALAPRVSRPVPRAQASWRRLSGRTRARPGVLCGRRCQRCQRCQRCR